MRETDKLIDCFDENKFSELIRSLRSRLGIDYFTAASRIRSLISGSDDKEKASFADYSRYLENVTSFNVNLCLACHENPENRISASNCSGRLENLGCLHLQDSLIAFSSQPTPENCAQSKVHWAPAAFMASLFLFQRGHPLPLTVSDIDRTLISRLSEADQAARQFYLGLMKELPANFQHKLSLEQGSSGELIKRRYLRLIADGYKTWYQAQFR